MNATTQLSSHEPYSNLHAVSKSVLHEKTIIHHPEAGINPLVDAASALFTLMSKLNVLSYFDLEQLQFTLATSVKSFENHLAKTKYDTDLSIVAAYALCAAFDDIIAHSTWGFEWPTYSLLKIFNHDPNHQERMLRIIDRIMKEPKQYLDLLEHIYFCFSLGYKGPFRNLSDGKYQLEQLKATLYKTIRNQRENFGTTLTPKIKPSNNAKPRSKNTFSLVYIGLMTASIIMIIFISLSYLMDVTANELINSLSQFENKIPAQAKDT